jgi:hypothetical protein
MFLSRDLFLFYGVSPPDRFAFDWKTMPQVTACLYFRTHLIANLGEIWDLSIRRSETCQGRISRTSSK